MMPRHRLTQNYCTKVAWIPPPPLVYRDIAFLLKFGVPALFLKNRLSSRPPPRRTWTSSGRSSTSPRRSLKRHQTSRSQGGLQKSRKLAISTQTFICYVPTCLKFSPNVYRAPYLQLSLYRKEAYFRLLWSGSLRNIATIMIFSAGQSLPPPAPQNTRPGCGCN